MQHEELVKKITRDELLAKLAELKALEGMTPAARAEAGRGRQDEETWHAEADEALIDFIGDEEIAKAYYRLMRWYA